jgi:hypothetical protein
VWIDNVSGKVCFASDFDDFDDFPGFNEVIFDEEDEEDNTEKDPKSIVSGFEQISSLNIPPESSRTRMKVKLPEDHGLLITPLSPFPIILSKINTLLNARHLTPFEARLIAASSVTDESQRAEIELRIQLPPMIADTPDKLSVPGQESLAHAATPLLLIVKSLHHNKMTERALIGI